MLGTIVITTCIVISSTVGWRLNKKTSSKYQDNLYIALSICSISFEHMTELQIVGAY